MGRCPSLQAHTQHLGTHSAGAEATQHPSSLRYLLQNRVRCPVTNGAEGKYQRDSHKVSQTADTLSLLCLIYNIYSARQLFGGTSNYKILKFATHATPCTPLEPAIAALHLCQIDFQKNAVFFPTRVI